MKLIKFEIKKIFLNKFFLGMLTFALCLNAFVLYENYKSNTIISSEAIYNTYDEYLDSVLANAEKSLLISIFDDSSDFSKKNIEKTAKDFEKMRGIEITSDKNDGVSVVFNSKISDFCILMLLISVGLSLIVDEKEKRLFHLIRSTKNGTTGTIFSKLTALLICCIFINTIITASTVGFASISYGFGDLHRSIQSVPELLTAFFRLNVAEFFFMHFTVKTIGIFIIGIIIILLCLLTKRAITMLVSVTLISALSVSMTFIPETSKFNFFKYINFYSFINPYHVLRAYTNLNIFGKPINLTIIFTGFAAITALLLAAVVAVYYVKKRPLENSDRKGNGIVVLNKIHNSIAYFELKKLLSLNKAIVIILIFALFQAYSVYNQENFQSNDEYYYKYYMEMLNGPLTASKESIILQEKEKMDEAENELNRLNEQRRNNELSLQEFIEKQEPYSDILKKSDMFNRVYERYLYIINNPNAEFIYDIGYERLFGISNPNFSIENSMLLLCVFSLCFCSIYSIDYKTGMYKILCTTKYGICKTKQIKTMILICLTALIFAIAYLPELIYIGRFYGFDGLSSQLISIPELAYFGCMPIWFAVVLLYLLRFIVLLTLIPVLSAISLKSKSNIITALLCLILFVVPIGAFYIVNIEFFNNISLWSLLSGSILLRNTSMLYYIIQILSLLSISVFSSLFVNHKFGKTIA